MYTLPISPNTALVEYTLFSEALLSQAEYRHGLQEYLENILGIVNYEIKEIEQGIIPMTDQIFTRKAGAHILNIGTKGGRVKPSSGYAFWRIHEDSKSDNSIPLQISPPLFHSRNLRPATAGLIRSYCKLCCIIQMNAQICSRFYSKRIPFKAFSASSTKMAVG